MGSVVKNRIAKGVMTIEAAILFGLLLIIVLGIIEYGWFFLKSQQVTNATRYAARMAVRPDITNVEVEAAVAQLMSDAGISGYSMTMADISTVPPGNTITVSISVPYTNVQLGGPPFVPLPSDVHASVSMAKEGL